MNNTLTYCGVTHIFQSKGLLDFLRLLFEAHPKPLCLTDITTRFPNTSPLQLARYIDTLESDNLKIVSYKTKTKGPYEFGIDINELFLPEITDAKNALPKPSMKLELKNDALDQYLLPAWIDWVYGLTQAILNLNSAHFSNDDGVYHFLDLAVSAAKQLPPWTLFVICTFRAHALERESRYREAGYLLRRIESAAADGTIRPSVLARARLCRAKILYDQGRYEASEKMIVSISNFNDLAIDC